MMKTGPNRLSPLAVIVLIAAASVVAGGCQRRIAALPSGSARAGAPGETGQPAGAWDAVAWTADELWVVVRPASWGEQPPGEELPGCGELRAEDPESGKTIVLPLEHAIMQAERAQITRALALTHGNKSEVARLLGITRRSLYRRLRRYGLE